MRDHLNPRGYIHRHDLLDAGWRPDRLRRAVAIEGLIVRRRQWILLPEAPPALHLAAIAGARAACHTAAELLGAWALDRRDRPHLRLAPHQSDTCTDATVHRSLDVVAVSPRTLVEPVVNALSQVAACVPAVEAAMIWESALNRGLILPADLARVPWPNVPSRERAREAVALSDSGLETRFVVGMRREGIAVRQQVLLLGRPVDGLIGDLLVTQIDGYGFHNDARTRRADIAHDALLRLEGYTVLRFDYHQITHGWTRVVADIRRALAQGLHRAD